MNCPRCTRPITALGRYCTGCGHDLGEEFYDRLSLFFAMKEELEHVGAVQSELAAGLANVDRRMREYEEMLGHDLEKSMAAVREAGQPEPGSASEPMDAASAVPEAESVDQGPEHAAGGPAFAPAAGPKRDSSTFEVRVGQKWLLVVGILAMVFGVGYFLKYSFEQGWVGPAGRVAMAYLWGIAFLVAGDRFRKKGLDRFGLSLIGGGIAVLYFSAFAAFQLYHLFDQTASFSIMVLITVLACALAVYYDTRWLAVLGLVGGFLTPVLLSTGQDNQIALMTYMTILNLGLLGIAFYKRWGLLNTLGFIFTYLLYAAWHTRHYADSKFWPAILFLNVFYLIYAFVPFTYQVRKGERSGSTEIILMGLNAFIAFGYGYFMIRELYGLAWVSIITVFYAGVFLSMATYFYRRGMQSLDVFIVLLAKAMVFLIITVPIIFSKHWITIFWSAQAVGLLWMAVKLERKSLVRGAYILLMAAVVKFLFYDYSVVFHFSDHSLAFAAPYADGIATRYAITLLVLGALYLAGLTARRASFAAVVTDHGDATFLFSALGGLLFIVLNVEVSSFFYDYLRQARFAAISVLWTLFSVALMLTGFRKNNAALRKVSFGLFLVVVLKVFLFDMADFSTPYRIISFIILGLVLVGTSYLYYRHKDRIITALADSGKKD